MSAQAEIKEAPFAHLIAQNIQRQKLLHRQNCAIQIKSSFCFFKLCDRVHLLFKSDVKAVFGVQMFLQIAEVNTVAALRV